MRTHVALLACALIGCSSNPTTDSGTPDAPLSDVAAADSTGGNIDATPAQDAPSETAADVPVVTTTVTLFSQTQFSFAGAANHRDNYAQVTLPTGPFSNVRLHIDLACPSNACDPWDRLGSLSVERQPSNTDAGADAGPTMIDLEFARFITTYGVSGSWDLDVTDLQPLLTGAQNIHGWIDTWVGPGSQYGNGWLLTATLTYTSGTPAHLPVQVVPLGWTNAVYGDPSMPISAQLAPMTVTIPSTGVVSSQLHLIVTGHGQGNLANCSEFCEKNHTVSVDGTAHTHAVWRSDCDQNPISNQNGTWSLARAGWCPGEVVQPWIEDLGTSLAPGSMHTFSYGIDVYTNTCRPDANPCLGCSLGNGCPYDGSTHTQPFYMLAAYLVLYGS